MSLPFGSELRTWTVRGYLVPSNGVARGRIAKPNGLEDMQLTPHGGNNPFAVVSWAKVGVLLEKVSVSRTTFGNKGKYLLDTVNSGIT